MTSAAFAFDDVVDLTPVPVMKKSTNSALFAPRLRLVGRTKSTVSWWLNTPPEHFTERAYGEVERMRDGSAASAVLGIALE